MREELDMQDSPNKKRWNHNLSLYPVNSKKRKAGTVYRQPFAVMTLQDKIRFKISSTNEAEKAERYTRANVLFGKFDEDHARHSPRMQNQLERSIMSNTNDGFPISRQDAVSTNASYLMSNKQYERQSMFDESGAISKWSAEPFGS